jgi:catechol 2,3-dioxygenase-like lactoylglutathione lyase family enzyme
MKRILLTLGVCIAACPLVSPAQTETPHAIGILNYVHAVNDVEKTVAFYKDVFGLELRSEPREFPNPGVPALTNAPGVKLKLATVKMPGAPYVMELTQFYGVERKPGVPQHTDPGAADLQLRVRDIDTVFAAIKKSGAPIITRSGAPVKVGPPDRQVRSILIRDPDGYVLEVIQLPVPAGAPAGQVFGVSMGLTVNDMEATRKFYHDMLGFDFTGDMKFGSDKAILDMVGAPAGAEFREMNSKVPGTDAAISFYEYKGLPRKPFHLRVRDPGAPALVLRVTDLDAMLTRLRAINTEVISLNGEPVQFSPTVRNIFVVDPNGVNLELYESK